MKVSDMVKWLSEQDQSLEVCIVESISDEDGLPYVETVCFDDTKMLSSRTEYCLILGVNG